MGSNRLGVVLQHTHLQPQEATLLYALVQASPGMFPLYDRPVRVDLTPLSNKIVATKGDAKVPVFALETAGVHRMLRRRLATAKRPWLER